MAPADQCKSQQKTSSVLDVILLSIGPFGRFQCFVYILVCFPMLFNAISSVTFVFTASGVAHRCNISECDTEASLYDEVWTKWAIPRDGSKLDSCRRFKSNASTCDDDSDSCEESICAAEYFDKNATVACEKGNFIFKTEEVTISNEFNIFCSDDWKLSLVGTINNFGQFFGIPLGGFISDRYGRAKSIAICGFSSAVMGLLRSFAPSYSLFLVFEFLDNLASSTLYSTCFVIGIELVGPDKRVIACTFLTIFYAIGEVVLALAAKYLLDWRLLLRVLYVPALIHLAYFWILPESVRWLLSQGEEEKATKLLKSAASINKRTVTEELLEGLLEENRKKISSAGESSFPLKAAFQTFYGRIANCAFCWIVNVLVYYGLSLNAVLLDGDKYNNFIFIALVEIPGFLLPFAVMDHLGRRYSLFVFMISSGLCCLVTIFISPDAYYWQLAFFLLGKLAITASFQVLYFLTSEIFPTTIRNSLLSFCSMVGRVGSMIAPQTPLLAKMNPNAPAILFACTAVTSGTLSLFFPETTNLVLPSTVKEAGSLGINSDSRSSFKD